MSLHIKNGLDMDRPATWPPAYRAAHFNELGAIRIRHAADPATVWARRIDKIVGDAHQAYAELEAELTRAVSRADCDRIAHRAYLTERDFAALVDAARQKADRS